MNLGRVDLRAGKQEIRWGRADAYNPTDNLIPYDYLDTFAAERMAVPALKGDIYTGAALFGGPRDGYLGQFREDGHLTVQLRYAF